jgi:hypothetical protein
MSADWLLEVTFIGSLRQDETKLDQGFGGFLGTLGRHRPSVLTDGEHSMPGKFTPGFFVQRIAYGLHI